MCVSLYHRMILGSEQPYLGKDVPSCGREGGLADPQGSNSNHSMILWFRLGGSSLDHQPKRSQSGIFLLQV